MRLQARNDSKCILLSESDSFRLRVYLNHSVDIRVKYTEHQEFVMSVKITSRQQLFGMLFVLGWLLCACLIRQHYKARLDTEINNASQPLNSFADF